MGNVYRQRDDVASDIVTSAIDRLKNPGGIKQHGYNDHEKPPLVPPLLPASKINKPSVWPKRISIPLPE